MLPKFETTVSLVNEWVGKAVASLLMVMMVITVYEVVARYFFDAPTIWTFELNQYLLCGITALAGGYTLAHKAHVNVEILYNRFSPRTKVIVDMFTSLLFFAFLVFFLWESASMATSSLEILEESESVWGPPIYPVKICIFVGALLLLLQGLAKFASDLVKLIKSEYDASPV